ncbi:MAG TPA: class I SAM-dependent methyltransferase [Candidatus Limnocylindria bacterium]|nr:class I SAM-dependent methyltransferase [Candidatus Limnocylindria bacterium]
MKLSPAALALFTGIEHLDLCQCRGCGFRFFDPVLPGNSAFYEDLQRQIPTYYPVTCPGFERILALAKKEGIKEVMDLGCGSGAFLDAAKEAGIQTHGLDLNSAAVANCRKRGHDVQNCTAEAYAASRPDRRFALVTAFEVMEHVPDPAAFFREGALLLAPGGYLGIAVPNGCGVHAIWNLSPYEWPPHHLSRWYRDNLRQLGEQSGLEVVSISGDPLRSGQLREFMQRQEQMEVLLGRRSKSNGALREAVVWGYRLLFGRHYFEFGNSLHALYRRR